MLTGRGTVCTGCTERGRRVSCVLGNLIHYDGYKKALTLTSMVEDGRKGTESLRYYGCGQNVYEISRCISVPGVRSTFVSNLGEVITAGSFRVMPAGSRGGGGRDVSCSSLVLTRGEGLRQTGRTCLTRVSALRRCTRRGEAVSSGVGGVRAVRGGRVGGGFSIGLFSGGIRGVVRCVRSPGVDTGTGGRTLRAVIRGIICRGRGGGVTVCFRSVARWKYGGTVGVCRGGRAKNPVNFL